MPRFKTKKAAKMKESTKTKKPTPASTAKNPSRSNRGSEEVILPSTTRTTRLTGGQKRTSLAVDIPGRKKRRTTCSDDPAGGDETATALTTADIPRIVAEVLQGVTHTGDQEDDGTDPLSKDEDGSNDEDEGRFLV